MLFMKQYLGTAGTVLILLGVLLDALSMVISTKRLRNGSGPSGIPFVVTLIVFYIPGVQFRNFSLGSGYQLLFWLLLVNLSCHFVVPFGIFKVFPGKARSTPP